MKKSKIFREDKYGWPTTRTVKPLSKMTNKELKTVIRMLVVRINKSEKSRSEWANYAVRDL